jgi:RNA-dependent RNA polymerase
MLIKYLDPCGVLKEGEIFIRSSRPLKIVVNGVEHNSDIVVGPVLVTRYPCVLPTDVQKVGTSNPALSSH